MILTRMIGLRARSDARRRFQRQLSITASCSLFVMLVGCSLDETDRELAELNDRGVAQMGQFQYAAAHDTFSSVLARKPDLIEVRVNLAIATLNRQDPGGEEATLNILRDVLDEDPSHQRALYTSGIVHLYLGNPHETIEFLSIVANLDPSDAYNAYFLGQAHLQIEEYERAKEWFLRAIELDEYLRSAYWAASTAARRLDDTTLANDLVETYTQYDANPLSKTAGISYKEMGPKAEALVLMRSSSQEPIAAPSGGIFQPSVVLLQDSIQAQSFTISDFDQDLDWDIHFVREGCIQTLENVDKNYQLSDLKTEGRCGDALTSETGTPSSLYWGDVNNDLIVDLVICGEEGVYVVETINDSDSTRNSIFNESCSEGVLYDADHDGDLDFLVISRGRVNLLNNNLDGTFSDISDSAGLKAPSQIVAVNVGDFDVDRDLDIALLDVRGRLHVLFNNRTWSYKHDIMSSYAYNSDVMAVADMNSDGIPSLLIAEHSKVHSVQYDPKTKTFETSQSFQLLRPDISQLSTVDFDGDGALDFLAASNDGLEVFSPDRQESLKVIERQDLKAVTSLYESADLGPSLITVSKSGAELHRPGPGRSSFISMLLTGKIDADQMRSNASAIGTKVKVRTADRWTILNTVGSSSGPGQSLQPLSIGLAGYEEANFVELLWTDGVTQSEIGLRKGELHRISELQRQLASCPVVFVWNGLKYEFLTDVLGVAALGYFHQVGENAPFRDFERILLPSDAIEPRKGYFEVKIGEPMEEVLYLDAAFIDTYDIPTTHGLVIDERLHVNSAQPSGRPIAFQREQIPSKALLDGSIDVTDEIQDQDFISPPLENKDSNYIGLLKDSIEIQLEFDEPLQTQNAVLAIYGWVEFPYSQTVFAASQGNRTYEPPSLDIRLPDGSWQTLISRFGYPAGMPKQMTLPLSEIPQGVRAIRLTTNMEIYWDQVRVVYEDPDIVPKHYRNEPSHGYVRRNGFAKRSTAAQRVPYYDYDDRTPYWDAKYATGLYSRTGEITELIKSTDNALAIVGSGEEVHLKFPDYLPPPIPEHERYYVLEFRGWAKDLDLYTEFSDTVEPLPSTGLLSREQRSKRTKLHREYNTRFRSGFVTH